MSEKDGQHQPELKTVVEGNTPLPSIIKLHYINTHFILYNKRHHEQLKLSEAAMKHSTTLYTGETNSHSSAFYGQSTPHITVANATKLPQPSITVCLSL